MHKNWVIKRYDQSVTCHADDLQTIETRSSTLRTPKTLSQTNNNIHKHSSNRYKGKTQEKKKIQIESSTKELRFATRINRIGATELKLRSKELRIQICLKTNFKLSKPCSS